MTARFVNDTILPWATWRCEQGFCACVGIVWIDGAALRGEAACKALVDLVARLPLRDGGPQPAVAHDRLRGLTGNFAFVARAGGTLVAATDKCRSYPLFWRRDAAGLILSGNARCLVETGEAGRMDSETVLEFRMAGFVTGADTLYPGLRQLQAGECLVHREGQEPQASRYYMYFPDALRDEPEEALLAAHHKALAATFDKMVATLDGRPVWIPLSGGLDSRLVLAGLLERGYGNVRTFTFGGPQMLRLLDVCGARQVAETAGVPWEFVPYNPEDLKGYFHSEERGAYFRWASGCCSVPFMSEMWALTVLQKKRLVSPDAIVINGQSGDYLTGGHIPKPYLDNPDAPVSFATFAAPIVAKHFSLWRNRKTPENLACIEGRIRSQLVGYVRDEMDATLAAACHELHEWQERQCKYVVNGQRMYEWFGLDWRLPLWSDELMEFWRNVPWRVKFGQALFKKYLHAYNPGGLFRLDIAHAAYYLPPLFKYPNFAWVALAKLFGWDAQRFQRQFVAYHWVYAPFYPQRSYRAFLRDSKNHRNYVSYYPDVVLADLAVAPPADCVREQA
ncbi:MAG: asparagine synthase-related protein [Desulfovibrionaceae bacterium]